ncbi:MAG TPA: nuclear transport factor 2 family protein [Streptosporangiaceae bacterium]
MTTAANDTDGADGAAAARLATDFFAAVGRGDVEGAMRAVAPDATVVIHPTGQRGGPEAVRGFFTEALAAFPDLLIKVSSCRGCSDGRALVELSFEGTQAADFLGAINQEKHLDIEQAWVLATDGAAITGVTGYWDQNRLYRRLAVKRLDQIAIA